MQSVNFYPESAKGSLCRIPCAEPGGHSKVPYVGFLVPGPATFLGSLYRVPCSESNGIPVAFKGIAEGEDAPCKAH